MEEKEKTPRAMHEKLKEDYERSVKQGNKGHAIGFCNEQSEEIRGMYRFLDGLYTIRKKDGNFFWWDYDAKNEGKNERPRFYKRI